MLTALERTPPEVLSLIFKAAADEPLGTTDVPIPLTICHIHKRWRLIALSSPEIWTTIRISRSHSVELAAHFLRLSQPLTFQLSVDTLDLPYDTGYTRPNFFEALIFPHLHRCSGIALRVTDAELWEWSAILLGHESAISGIRSLSITIHSGAPEELWGPPRSPAAFAGLLPAIRSLRLSTSPSLDDAGAFMRVTTLNVRWTYSGMDSILRIIRTSRHLQTLVLREFDAELLEGVCSPAHGVDGQPPVFTHLVLQLRDGCVQHEIARGIQVFHRLDLLHNLERLDIIGGKHTTHYSESAPMKFATIHPDSSLGSVDRDPLPRLRLRAIQLDNICFKPRRDVLTITVKAPDGIHFANVEWPASLHCAELPAKGLTVANTISPLLPGELTFYTTGEFEPAESVHVCSDFCAIPGHNSSPWARRDGSSSTWERAADCEIGVR
ncbi:hypothetical protein FB45DRAFT_121635 [Roridomyces roridus]|uniref:F-box domain-containing protein n=1 Tax=Roridomyces roridus TaxID=1738132 RepID=A0AAD7BIN3_9AGAR|nr:hypothetical protein FB45DRAFT_121635 [Roridomyces roridus]